MRIATVGVLCLLGLWLVAGCGSGETGRQAVSGSVRVGGEALEAGMITFVPQPGTAAPAAATVVSGGSYRFTAANGPLPGDYTARVSSSVIAAAPPAALPASVPPAAAAPAAATAPESSVRSKRGIAAVAGDSAASSATAAGVPQPLQWETPVTVSAEGSATKDFAFPSVPKEATQ